METRLESSVERVTPIPFMIGLPGTGQVILLSLVAKPVHNHSKPTTAPRAQLSASEWLQKPELIIEIEEKQEKLTRHLMQHATFVHFECFHDG